MSSRVKIFFQYLVIFGLTALLVWFSLRGLQAGEIGKWDYLKKTWAAADKGWLAAMAIVAIFSHLVRALRWQMLLEPSGHRGKISYSFLSLMIGYLVNMVIPRGGEVSRCYNLYKLNKTPVDISFGTVVVERLVDVLCLLILIIVSFVLESQKLFQFIATLPLSDIQLADKIPLVAMVLLGLTVLFISLFVFVRRSKRLHTFMNKVWVGFRAGFFSIFRLKNKKLFIFYSVVIWALYFLMSYTVIMAFEATSLLGWSAVLNLFAIGAIAMAVPLPGGAGSYHVLVPQSLVLLYQVPMADAVAFTFIFHGWQTLILIVVGALSLVITTIIIKRQSDKTTNTINNSI